MPSWARKYWLEVAWVIFAAVNVAATIWLSDYETVPFHFVWISLSLLYAWRVWRLELTLLTLGAVCIATGLALGWVVVQGPQGPDELTEVPLMATVFLAMVWHAERRRAALGHVQLAASREHEFVRAAAHQLKTPITIARGLASLVTADGEDAAEDDMASLIEELDHLARLADDLLLLAAAEQHDSLIRTQVDFEDLIAGAARRWSRTEERGWSVVACDGILLNADRHRLDSALDAIIENAVKATSVADGVSIVGRSDGNVAVIEISDTGVGMSAEALEHVFERFWSRPMSPDIRRGSGLGLPIVTAIVEAHGGAVSLVSTVGLGTTVTIRLPGFRAHAPSALPGGPLTAARRDSSNLKRRI
jgi:signal transduction histidine kinase